MSGTPIWPLTEAQSGLWYAQQLAPANPGFNIIIHIILKQIHQDIQHIFFHSATRLLRVGRQEKTAAGEDES